MMLCAYTHTLHETHTTHNTNTQHSTHARTHPGHDFRSSHQTPPHPIRPGRKRTMAAAVATPIPRQDLARGALQTGPGEAGPQEHTSSADASSDFASRVHMHGILGSVREWPAPTRVTEFDVPARSTFTGIKAHEYEDKPAVLRAKISCLANLLKSAEHPIAYTGAGISTAAGIDDYASKAKKQSVTAAGRAVVKDWKNALPTTTHYALVSLWKSKLLSYWVQQNHDSLPQKAGFPQYALNEIHGSLHDPANPIVPYEGVLRDDLYTWMKTWEQKADLCLALGTSMSGFNCDSVPANIGSKYVDRGVGLGLVIVNLQQTPYDEYSTLRIYAKTDVVFEMLLKELGMPMETQLYSPKIPEASRLGEDQFRIPFDAEGNRVRSIKERNASTWDLRVGAWVRLTGGPYEGDVGQVVAKNRAGHYRIRFAHSFHPVFKVRRRTFSLWLGSWWIEMACRGMGIVPDGRIPFVNTDAPGSVEEGPDSTDRIILSKYRRLQKAGLSNAQIRHKMRADNVSPQNIELFFSGS